MDLSSEKIKSSYKSSKRTQERKAAAVLLRHKYTTRQIMEIMELRRRQMGLATEEENPELAEATQEIRSEVVESMPQSSSSREVLDRGWEQPVGDSLTRRDEVRAAAPVVAASQTQTVPVTIEAYDEPWHVKPLGHVKSMMDYLSKAVSEAVLAAAAFMLFFVMLAHILGSGGSGDYEQGPFIALAVFLTVWIGRRRLNRGTKSLWIGAVSLITGLAAFAYGAFQAQVYVALVGFVLTAAGIFCGRYTKETANRLMFPLMLLAFAIAPPDLFFETVAPKLNALVAQGSAVILSFLRVPAHWQGNVFDMGGYQFFLDRDTAVLRGLIAALPLAALYTHYRFKRSRGRRALVALAVVPVVLLGGIAHSAGTGWVAYTYGNPYADSFYGLGASVMLFVLGLFAFIDSVIAEDEVA